MWGSKNACDSNVSCLRWSIIADLLETSFETHKGSWMMMMEGRKTSLWTGITTRRGKDFEESCSDRLHNIIRTELLRDWQEDEEANSQETPSSLRRWHISYSSTADSMTRTVRSPQFVCLFVRMCLWSSRQTFLQRSWAKKSRVIRDSFCLHQLQSKLSKSTRFTRDFSSYSVISRLITMKLNEMKTKDSRVCLEGSFHGPFNRLEGGLPCDVNLEHFPRLSLINSVM